MTSESHDFKVTEELVNSRIDQALTILTDLTRNRIKTLINERNVLVNNNVVKPSYKLSEDDTITLHIPPSQSTDMTPADIALDIIFEDEDLLVINKPAGLVVHPGIQNYQNTLANACLHYLGENLSSIGGIERPGIVHRLDKDTSGLIMIAKNDIAHNELSKQLADKTAIRKYLALVWGVPKPLKGTINKNIGRAANDRTKMQAYRNQEIGKNAITHYEVIEVLGEHNLSLVTCRLETGRTHQIRVHMSDCGHSIFGDQTYGSHKQKLQRYLKHLGDNQYLQQFHRQALHAAELTFIHPRTQELMTFTSELPEDFSGLLKQFKSKNE